jgi:mRNA interferase RelE/StbE
VYRIEVSPSAYRDLQKLTERISKSDFERIREAIRSLSEEPRPDGVRKIKGAERSFRVRVGNYRVIYDMYDSEKLVVLIQVSRRNENTYK